MRALNGCAVFAANTLRGDMNTGGEKLVSELDQKLQPFVVPLLTIVGIAYVAAIVDHMHFDALYRTVFIEELHTGEAGRSRYLFGEWTGEGGRWQSIISTPLASITAWAGFNILGYGLVELRLAFLPFTIISLLLFFYAVFKEAPRAPLLASLTCLTFLFSPMLTTLRPTSTNELIYPAIACLLLVLLHLIPASTERRQLGSIFACGLVASSAVLVKLDGFAIPVALAILVMLETYSGRFNKAQFLAFAAGCIVGSLILGVLIFTIMGLDRFIDGLVMTDELMARFNPYGRSTLERLYGALVVFPKNLDVYVAGQSFVLVFALALGMRLYSVLSLPARYCLVLLAFTVSWIGFAPLIYWKKVTIAVVPALYLSFATANYAAAHLRSLRPTRLFGSVVFVALALGAASYSAQFKGMWHVVPGWDSMRPIHLAASAGTILLLLFALWRSVRPVHLVTVSFVGMCLVTTALGIFQLVGHPRSRESFAIGEAVGPLLNGSLVVGDQNGFRFTGYFTNARYRFFQENDPEFPEGLYSLIRATEPEFVLVTDTYAPLTARIASDFPKYSRIATYEYMHPLPSFGDKDVRHKLVLFRRAPTQ
ncbi:MAG: hypothetical protein ABL893_12385 [Hyphomicrobium sp.]